MCGIPFIAIWGRGDYVLLYYYLLYYYIYIIISHVIFSRSEATGNYMYSSVSLLLLGDNTLIDDLRFMTSIVLLQLSIKKLTTFNQNCHSGVLWAKSCMKTIMFYQNLLYYLPMFLKLCQLICQITVLFN